LRDAAQSLLNGLPTTLEEDTKILRIEKKQLERLLGLGRDDVNKKDVIQAIEYRMAFKRALRLAVEVAEKEGMFYVDDAMEEEL
jgi:shikimate kinase